MLFSGSGELSGTSMMRMPASKIASPIRLRLVRRHAADDGDQRTGGEMALEKGMHQICPAMATIPARKAASPSIFASRPARPIAAA